MEQPVLRSPISRRAALAGGVGAALSACAPVLRPGALASAAESAPLKELASRGGRRFGSAVAWGAPGADRASFANPAYAAILERECELLVPENELKWQWTRPAADRFAFQQFDSIMA